MSLTKIRLKVELCEETDVHKTTNNKYKDKEKEKKQQEK